VGGVLTNTHAGGNLVSDPCLATSSCTVEFRFPKDGNSASICGPLRGAGRGFGRDGREPRGDGRPRRDLGFLIPNQNAARGAGEWQTYDITLVAGMVTVVLNGKEVICRRTFRGPRAGRST